MVHHAAWSRSLLWLLALSLGFASPPCKARIYTNHWAVRIAGGAEVAEHIAQKYGYRNMGQVSHVCSHKKLLVVCVSLSGPEPTELLPRGPAGTKTVEQDGTTGASLWASTGTQLPPAGGGLPRAVWVT